MTACFTLLELARACIGRAAKTGALVVDATAGNGNDTIFLASLVGPDGLVLAFDIQAEALERTRAALEQAGLSARARLFLTSHENIAACLPANPQIPSAATLAASLTACAPPDAAIFPGKARLGAAMFNLGFLPGSDKEIATRPGATLAALNGLLPFMSPGAAISVHCYSGHDGGREESMAVLDWAAKLPESFWRVWRYETLNKKRGAENLVLLERMPGVQTKKHP